MLKMMIDQSRQASNSHLKTLGRQSALICKICAFLWAFRAWADSPSAIQSSDVCHAAEED
jgi:hypothetical protein